jgi:4-amino-4-deoxy-L-arabinose transferase-like glycosyltransferase
LGAVLSPRARAARVFIPVLLLAALLRCGTFFIGHGTGDQIFYHAVAMKLEKEGLAGYSLQNVALSPAGAATEIVTTEDSDKTLLTFQRSHQGFYAYDQPLFHAPPLLPYMIMLVHRALAPDLPYRYQSYDRKGGFDSTELHLTLVPYLFSLLTVVTVYAWGLLLFDVRTALCAAILLSVSPMDILCASRVWPDALVSFGTCSSLLLYHWSSSRRSPWWAVAAGLLTGMAALVKVTGLFAIVIVLVHAMVSLERPEGQARSKIIFRPALFIGTALLVTLPWFLLVYQTYGTPFQIPFQRNIERVNAWYAFVRHRPWFMYPLDLLVQNPAWILFLVAALDKTLETSTRYLLLIWPLAIWFCFAAFPVFSPMVGLENRYLLPAYPAMALLAAKGATSLYEKLAARPKATGYKLALSGFLIAAALASATMGIQYAYVRHVDEIVLPV